MCQRLACAGLAYDDLLSCLNFRKRKKIIEALNGGYKEVTFNQKIHDKLINQVIEEFNVVLLEDAPEETQVADDDFVQLDENYKLPWDE